MDALTQTAFDILTSNRLAKALDNDVAVVAWGEFGRTPLINKDAGGDHWPQVGGGLLAGGGFRKSCVPVVFGTKFPPSKPAQQGSVGRVAR